MTNPQEGATFSEVIPVKFLGFKRKVCDQKNGVGDSSTRDTVAAKGTADSAFGDQLVVGAPVGDYTIDRVLGHGGCGIVYLGTHTLLGRQVAIKVLHRIYSGSPEMVERFVREARAVNTIAHPNLIDIFGFGELDDGRPYYVMEYIEGAIDLGQLIAEVGRLSAGEALELLEPMAAGLHAAHESGIIHRDLKAGNVIVSTGAGQERVVKLHDFGIAKLLEPAPGSAALTATGQRLGTPSAMAPEQILGGAVDARTDVYAVGVLLFHMLTGALPFDGASPEEVELLHLKAERPRPSERAPVSAEVDAVVMQCMDPDRDRRYSDVPALMSALRAAVVGSGELSDAREHAHGWDAIALYLDARMTPTGDPDRDDDLLDELDALIERAEKELTSAGFLRPVRVGSNLLAVLPDGDTGSGQRVRAADTALRLESALTDHSAAIQLSYCLHCARAVEHGDRQGVTQLSGPIMQIATWAPATPLGGVCVTERFGPPPIGSGMSSEEAGNGYLRLARG